MTLSGVASKERLPTKRVSEGLLGMSPCCEARLLALSLGFWPSGRGVLKSRLRVRLSRSVPFLALRAAVAASTVSNST